MLIVGLGVNYVNPRDSHLIREAMESVMLPLLVLLL